MLKRDPHAPYAEAVMEALGDLHDPADSFYEYASDNGEVMLMEIVITLDPDKARAAGWSRGLLICWDQTTGWEWAYLVGDHGGNSTPEPLIVGSLVTDPADIVRAVQTLLTGASDELPIVGSEREPHAASLSPALQKALGSGPGDADLSQEAAAALALYAL